MICYKGNSFFRIFKILIKDFVEKVKLSFMKRFTNFKRHMSKKNLFFVQIKKFFVISVPLKSGQININQTIPEKGKN